ncbi:GAF domain-containing protein [Paenibacillus marinisediminis]
MFQPAMYSGDPARDYPMLRAQLAALIEDEPSLIANLANASALLWHGLKDINWAGFYLYEASTNQLVLGPFQGLPACVRIPLGRGVCGTAAAERITQVVPDVHAFPGHIACDANSRSEIVVPLIRDGELVGVLDIDSPILERFGEQDRQWLEELARLLMIEQRDI